MKEVIFSISIILILPLTVLITSWIDRLQNSIRRKKHPVYYESYDAAMKICFGASAKVKHEASYLECQFKLLTEGLIEGECTETYFKDRFEQLANMHIKTTLWFKEQQKYAEKLFKEADLYAKKNNLTWGVIY